MARLTNAPIIDMIATGIVLKNKMTIQNISISELADMLGVSYQAVAKWRTGQTLPSVDNLVVLAQVFQCTVDDLLVIQ